MFWYYNTENMKIITLHTQILSISVVQMTLKSMDCKLPSSGSRTILQTVKPKTGTWLRYQEWDSGSHCTGNETFLHHNSRSKQGTDALTKTIVCQVNTLSVLLILMISLYGMQAQGVGTLVSERTTARNEIPKFMEE